MDTVVLPTTKVNSLAWELARARTAEIVRMNDQFEPQFRKSRWGTATFRTELFEELVGLINDVSWFRPQFQVNISSITEPEPGWGFLCLGEAEIRAHPFARRTDDYLLMECIKGKLPNSMYLSPVEPVYRRTASYTREAIVHAVSSWTFRGFVDDNSSSWMDTSNMSHEMLHELQETNSVINQPLTDLREVLQMRLCDMFGLESLTFGGGFEVALEWLKAVYHLRLDVVRNAILHEAALVQCTQYLIDLGVILRLGLVPLGWRGNSGLDRHETPVAAMPVFVKG